MIIVTLVVDTISDCNKRSSFIKNSVSNENQYTEVFAVTDFLVFEEESFAGKMKEYGFFDH